MKKILLIDDQPGFINMMGAKLESMQYEVVHTGDGESGLAMAREEIPDLIIMDITMPVMDGLTCAAEIRGIPELETVPIIFLSARNRDEDRARGEELGAAAWFDKPFSPRELVRKIEKLLAN